MNGIIGFKGYEIIRNGNVFVASFVDIKRARCKLVFLGNMDLFLMDIVKYE